MRIRGVSPLLVLSLLAGCIAVLPLAGVLVAALSGDPADIATRDIGRYAATSAWLSLFVGLVTAFVGTIAAWLVVMHQFPGRGFFAWALALPLAAPAFALAYAYADLFDVAGELRMWMREAPGFDLPIRMRSMPGAVFVLSCAFYPYVYLAMRAAFVNQSASVLEVSRTLGCKGVGALWRVALPMARPALAAGVALAVMETLADYGALQFLSVQTLTTGVIRAWSVYGSTAGAAQLALPLLATAAVLLWFERQGRNARGFESVNARWRPLPVARLDGWKAVAATLYCAMLLIVGLLLPAGWLAWTALRASPDLPRLIDAGVNSLGLGLAGAAVTVFLATALALGGRRSPLATRLASLGYATPGAAMAIGLLVPAALLWKVAPSYSNMFFALGLLLYAYAARLMAAALEPIDAGLAKVTPQMVWASRSLGRSEMRTAWNVQLPLVRGSLLTAALVVFVDILKELPATLILRPFDFDTLAVIANNYALDERLGQAGLPSLLIVALALPAVVWLTRKIDQARPGATAEREA